MSSSRSNVALVLAVLAAIFLGQTRAANAESSQEPSDIISTQLVLKLGTEQALPIDTSFDRRPPTIVIRFQDANVAGALPARSVIAEGPIRQVDADYHQAGRIETLKIALREAYPYDVQSQPGRIVVTIRHPRVLGGADVELGASSAEAAVAVPSFTERFRAMEEALDRATPHAALWEFDGSSEPEGEEEAMTETRHATTPRAPRATLARRKPAALQPGWWWAFVLVAFAGLGWRFAPAIRRVFGARPPRGSTPPRVPAAVRVIDQLVWRAFERQGYQLQQIEELAKPLGILRLAKKDQETAALLCVGEGTFFEKVTVEQFAQALKRVRAGRGFLVAPGSFTIPAQRVAKEHQITLLGRDQLIELLNEGAMSESYVSQLQSLQIQLDEANALLGQANAELDVLRRQRNDASWFLGEERAKVGALEAQITQLTERTSQLQADAEQWRQTAAERQKQWEESEWYLGEARASTQHLEQQLQELQRSVEELKERLDAERTAREAVNSELQEVRTNGERRRAPRLYRPDVTIEVQQPDGEVVFHGIARDLSPTGFGFVSQNSLISQTTDDRPLQIRVREVQADRMVVTSGRMVWERRDDSTNQFVGGVQFLESILS